jgi:hypothetical protein
VNIGTDLVALFGGSAGPDVVPHLRDAVKDLAPEIATITGLRQEAFEHGVEFVTKVYQGAIDLEWMQQFTRAALAVCDARVNLTPEAFKDEAAYAVALRAQLAALAPPAPAPGQPVKLAYDRASHTLTVTLDGHKLTIDVKQLADDVAHELFKSRNRKILFAVLRPVLLAAVPGAGPYLAACLICLALVQRA